jgi:hypothetical protein
LKFTRPEDPEAFPVDPELVEEVFCLLIKVATELGFIGREAKGSPEEV